MKVLMQYIVAWALLFTSTLVPEVISIDCPNLPECDCRRERNWSNSDSNSYSIVECDSNMDAETIKLPDKKDLDIRTLILRNTSVRSLNKKLFSGLQIESITIQNQKIDIHQDAFIQLKHSLKSLSLINVNISRRWKLDYLKHLENVETLVLDENGIWPEHFPNNVFTNYSLTSLKYLSLKHCKIARMNERSLEGLPNLETLDLSNNSLPEIPSALLLLRNLRKLNLSFNKRLIYVHDNAFRTLKNLEEIDISNSGLSTISESAFSGLENSLTSLYLHHALLQDGHFTSMKELKKLKFVDISYNEIAEMHNTSFEGFVALEELDISGQLVVRDGVLHRLDFIDSVFKGVERKLKILRIRDLGLDTSLPLGALKSLIRLQTLDASKNRFTEIYESFFYGIKARNIYLTDMKISSISNFAFETLRPGVNIYFDRNNITNISFVLDTPICLFEKLSLIGNPVVCDCDVIEIAATNRVQKLIGACADDFYRGENVKTIHELDIAKKNCDIKGYKKITHCSYVNSSVKTSEQHVVLITLFIFLFV